MSSNKKLSIIIVNFQSKDFLKKCLASVFNKLGHIDFEVIVVNNDGKEDLAEIKNNFSSVKIINHRKNVGFGAGQNLGAKEAQGEFFLILNPDTELIDDILPIINLFNNENIGAIGPQLVDEKELVQEWSVGVETSIWDILKNNLGFPESRKIWQSKKTKKVGRISGAAFFIRKDLFEKMGGFDEKFFMYYEDEDLCQRIRAIGKKIIYFPKVKVRHWGGRSVRKKKTQKKYFYEAQEYYFRKHLGKWQTFFLKILRKAILGV